MPIILNNFKWSQTPSDLTVRIQFNERISTKFLDIFTQRNFIKINAPPYLFEKFLSHPIDESQSRCKILEKEVIFHLKKRDEFMWDHLELEVTKSNTVKTKEEIITEAHQNAETERKLKSEQKQEKKREEIRREIERETKNREEIDGIKKVACNTEIQSIEQWKSKEPKDCYRDLFFKPKPIDAVISTPRPKEEWLPNKKIEKIAIKKKTSPPQQTVLPAIRTAGTIVVDFSERRFPTPSRESQAPEEMEWLAKQHEARKTIGFVEEDLRPEERNPQWLKEKGDEFIGKKNYLGAISAYSTAIRMCDKFYELYMNRSAAHFALENYSRCAEDCSQAYELMTPHCEANRRDRIVCMSRRGIALERLGYIRQGYEEMVSAVRLDPKNPELIRQAEMMRSKLENNSN